MKQEVGNVVASLQPVNIGCFRFDDREIKVFIYAKNA